MEMEVNAIMMEKNPQYSSSVVKSALFHFYGRSVSIFKAALTYVQNPDHAEVFD